MSARLRDLLATAAERLIAAGIAPEEARMDALLLARDALGWDTAAVLAHEREPAPPGFEASYATAVVRRSAREPMAYIRGRAEFWGREFLVSPAVLIPRPETELLVESALSFLDPGITSLIVDVGTGSGCVAVTIACERPHAQVVATDISADAIAVARHNARRHDVEHRIAFRIGALLDVVDQADLVVSNPPYVPERDRSTLAPEVGEFEPHAALFGGIDGLDVVRLLVGTAAERTRSDGWLLFEFGYGQAAGVRSLLDASGAWTSIRLRADLQGIPRVAEACRR